MTVAEALAFQQYDTFHVFAFQFLRSRELFTLSSWDRFSSLLDSASSKLRPAVACLTEGHFIFCRSHFVTSAMLWRNHHSLFHKSFRFFFIFVLPFIPVLPFCFNVHVSLQLLISCHQNAYLFLGLLCSSCCYWLMHCIVQCFSELPWPRRCIGPVDGTLYQSKTPQIWKGCKIEQGSREVSSSQRFILFTLVRTWWYVEVCKSGFTVGISLWIAVSTKLLLMLQTRSCHVNFCKRGECMRRCVRPCNVGCNGVPAYFL